MPPIGIIIDGVIENVNYEEELVVYDELAMTDTFNVGVGL